MRIGNPRNGRASLGGGASSALASQASPVARAALSALAALALAAGFWGCDLMAGRTGGGTETETAGVVRNTDGSLAVNASVLFRPADYLADSLLTSEQVRPYLKEITDQHGRFRIRGLAPGAYRMEVDGGNGRGLVRDFVLDQESQHLVLPEDTLRTYGTISGSFVLDSALKLPRYVQIYGLERLVLADPANGAFMIPNLPPGSYDLRCLGLEPFRKQAVVRGVQVVSGGMTRLDPIVLEEIAKLTFRVESGALAIDGVGPASPLIFDNEYWDNGVETEYIWAKASRGLLDLRGNVVTDGVRGAASSVDAEVAKARRKLQVARQAGLSKIPDPVAGSGHALLPSLSGRLDDIVPEKSEGSELIVAAARKATPENPLVVVAGGPLTTVANAYLTDPSIAPRMVVMAVYPFTINAYDTLATYVVAKRCRLVVWGRGYVWADGMDTARVAALPGNRMAERVRNFLMPAARKGRTLLGDIAPVAYLFDRKAWTGAAMAKVSLPLQVSPASNLAFDFLDVPAAANAWDAYLDEFFAALGDSGAYAPVSLPGRLEAEGYAARLGVRGALTAPGSAPDTSLGDAMAGAVGAWLEFKVSAAAAEPRKAVARCRSQSGGRLSLAYVGGPVLAEIPVTAGNEWVEVEADLALEAGVGVLKATWSQGSFELDWIQVR